MPKRHNDLYDKIVDFDNLLLAYKKTARGKKFTYGYLEFKEYEYLNLRHIQTVLENEQYEIGEYREFTVYEPKPRLISALGFSDRLVQHAVCNVIAPIIEKTFLPYSFACRKGMGTHSGVVYLQSKMRKIENTHYLKIDFSKYFASMNQNIIHKLFKKSISCKKTLNLIEKILSKDGNGIPIGSLISQLIANMYGNMIDYYLQFALKIKYWVRYMDDIVILGSCPTQLKKYFVQIQEYVENVMMLKISRWNISAVSQGVNFLGYRIWTRYKLLRKNSVIRAKRKISRYIKYQEYDNLTRFLGSWLGHAQWADTHNLLKWLRKTHFEKFHYSIVSQVDISL